MSEDTVREFNKMRRPFRIQRVRADRAQRVGSAGLRRFRSWARSYSSSQYRQHLSDVSKSERGGAYGEVIFNCATPVEGSSLITALF